MVIVFEMFQILALCPALLAASVQTLTIDSVLGTSIEDCFERVSIGEQLSPDAISRNITELTTRECENICKHDKTCQSYDYGVGAVGNATCNLSEFSEKELNENKMFMTNTDYDVYVRRILCEQPPPSPLQPQSDEPISEPNNKPIFKPGLPEEPKRPGHLSDDFQTYGERPHDSYPQRPYDPYRKPNYYNHGGGNTRPGYGEVDYRPDDYTDPKPELEGVIGYGFHKPQDIPYKPNKPYRPGVDHNYGNQRPKPDPYDELHFQDQYSHMKPLRPHKPGFWRPDPLYPQRPDDIQSGAYGQNPIKPIDSYPERPSYYPEQKPQYQYFVRPTKKPVTSIPSYASDGYVNKPSIPGSGYGHDRPDQDYNKPGQNYNTPDLNNDRPDPSYNKPDQNYNRPGYNYNRPGQNYNLPDYDKPSYSKPELSHTNGPIGPPSGSYGTYGHLPNKPHRPSGSYYGGDNGQYAGGYGQNQDNYIYLEIKDPPNYYKPTHSRPDQSSQNSGYDATRPHLGYGYDHHSHSQFQNNYSQHGHYESNYDHNYNKPVSTNRPSYGSQNNQFGYGGQSSHFSSSHSNSYGSQSSQSHTYHGSTKPGYGNQDSGYGNQNGGAGSQDVGYGGYGSSHSSYEGSGYSNKDKLDGYGNQKPANGSGYPGGSDLKPVYEYELNGGSGGDGYGFKPAGQVVSSRPVSVSDYGTTRPGEKRDPVSYKGWGTWMLSARCSPGTGRGPPSSPLR
ncbi:hypothetical protein EVAR_67462_1 [Eumeta japonica]|uniref:Apple domain-containing protein n=1 Tax=Eumeta variegata TaxID=151549 RepID=A0A4C1ZND8_EUMVA|nr:hypothetical protein EVAR_67462_1 [Eumeta japonica]